VVVVEGIVQAMVLITAVVVGEQIKLVIGLATMITAKIMVVLEVGAKLGTAFKEGAAVAVVPTMEMVEPPAPEEVVVEVVDTLCVAPRE
jgi:hypothetical protein